MGTPTIPRLAQHVVASVCDVRRARGEMIGVDKIEDIRRRRSRGESIASISRNTGVSEPTVRKYLRMEDLSPSRPGRRIAESELLEPYEATIDHVVHHSRLVEFNGTSHRMDQVLMLSGNAS